MFARLLIGLLLITALTVSLAPALASGDAVKGEREGDVKEAAQEAVDLNPMTKVQADLAIWTAVVFLVLVAVLGKFAWGPLTAGLERREQSIADHISQAEAANRQAKELLAQHEAKLNAAKDEVRGILEAARRDAERVGQEMIDRARTEAAAEQQRALKQIDAATASAMKEIADKAAGLAVELAGKIVGAKLNASDHTRLIEQAVGDFTRSRN